MTATTASTTKAPEPPRSRATASTRRRCSPRINAVAGSPSSRSSSSAPRTAGSRGTHSAAAIEPFNGAGGEHAHKAAHIVDADHPAVLCGADKAPTPVEFLLHALAACLTAGIANIAAARGVTLTRSSRPSRATSTCRASSACRTRSATATSDPRQLRDRGRRAGREAARDRRAVACPLGRLRHPHQRRAGRDRSSKPRPEPAPTSPGGAAAAPPAVPNSRSHDDAADRRVIIGAGQAGLAMSRCLGRRGIDHVVLERGRVGGALAQRALGLAAAAHARTGRAALPGFALRRPRPRRLHARAARSSSTSSATRAPFAAPVRAEHGGAARSRRVALRAIGVTTDRGGWRARQRRDRDRPLRRALRAGDRARAARRRRRS